MSVDGTVLGSTPLEQAEVAPGEHEISIEAPRYAPASMRIQVRGMGERQLVQAVGVFTLPDVDSKQTPAPVIKAVK